MTGDVIKVTPFYFKLVERGKGLSSASATGRIIHIPNHMILNNELYNFSQLLPINWTEVRYRITVDSKWQDALAVVEDVGEVYMEEFLQRYEDEDVAAYQSRSTLFDESLKVKTYVFLDDDGIDIVAQVPVHYTEAATTKSELNKKILPKLSELADVEMNAKAAHIHIDNFRQAND